MVETNIPKDIRVYKTRVVGPLTLRQLICLCVAAALDGLLYLVFENLLHVPVRIYISSDIHGYPCYGILNRCRRCSDGSLSEEYNCLYVTCADKKKDKYKTG